MRIDFTFADNETPALPKILDDLPCAAMFHQKIENREIDKREDGKLRLLKRLSR